MGYITDAPTTGRDIDYYDGDAETVMNAPARFLNTAEAMDYTPDELDDLTSRKVEAVEFDGDALARLVRARRGTARYLDDSDPYSTATDNGDFNLWNGSGWPTEGRMTDRGNRRMAAVGHGYPESMGEPRITSEMRHQVI